MGERILLKNASLELIIFIESRVGEYEEIKNLNATSNRQQDGSNGHPTGGNDEVPVKIWLVVLINVTAKTDPDAVEIIHLRN